MHTPQPPSPKKEAIYCVPGKIDWPVLSLHVAQNYPTFDKAEKEKKSQILFIQTSVFWQSADLPFATKQELKYGQFEFLKHIYSHVWIATNSVSFVSVHLHNDNEFYNYLLHDTNVQKQHGLLHKYSETHLRHPLLRKSPA
jgi:hypothetical protein